MLAALVQRRLQFVGKLFQIHNRTRMHKAPNPKPGRCFALLRDMRKPELTETREKAMRTFCKKDQRKRGISQSDLRDRSLSQSCDITLTQIPVKMFPIFSHVTLTSL